MSGAVALDYASTFALLLLVLAMLLSVVRLVRGPSLGDRILALDLITTLAVGFIAVVAVRTGFFLYVDIAVAIALLGFLSTIAFARYLLRRAEARAAGSRELIE
jgi:multicomponent Na+:H+ antiporter subunit F